MGPTVLRFKRTKSLDLLALSVILALKHFGRDERPKVLFRLFTSKIS